jgi:signal peptidase II
VGEEASPADHPTPAPVTQEQVKSRSRLQRAIIFCTCAISGFLLDIATKTSIFAWQGWPGEQAGVWWIIPEYLGIQTSVNPGAVFGLGAGYSSVFAALSFVALGVIGYVALIRQPALHGLLFYTLAFITAGILGNLYDRLGLHHTAELPADYRNCVRDWILFQCREIPLKIFNPWPNFNIADCFLVVGSIILAIHSFMAEEPKSSSNSPLKR